MSRFLIWAIGIILIGCSQPSPFPEMQPGETGRVTRIIDGDALVLETGQSVRLVSIVAPSPARADQPGEPHASESARALEDMALGRRVQLYYPGLTRDRYDRALAHVVTIDGAGPQIWLNQAMIEQGAARVRLYPGTAARGLDLLALEQRVRVERKGLWRHTDYRVKTTRDVTDETRAFLLVDATLGDLVPRPDLQARDVLCARAVEASAFVVHVHGHAETVCDLPSCAPVQMRGWVSDGALALTHTWHLQPQD